MTQLYEIEKNLANVFRILESIENLPGYALLYRTDHLEAALSPLDEKVLNRFNGRVHREVRE